MRSADHARLSLLKRFAFDASLFLFLLGIIQKSYHEATGRYWYHTKVYAKHLYTIKRALPDMFHYLENTDIPKSTNALESFFGHLKQNITIHRSLSKGHYKNYIKWYLFFKSNENRFSSIFSSLLKLLPTDCGLAFGDIFF